MASIRPLLGQRSGRFVGVGPKGAGMTEAEHRTVAVVDDDQAVRDSLRFLLEVIGYTVEIFASAAEFLLANVRNFACLILDHHMPNMTGLELAERLRADGAVIPILLITGSPSPTITARAAGLGIKVLDKPPTDEALIDFINGTRR
jgi:two-component system, LuxR family, response regulator FixJ